MKATPGPGADVEVEAHVFYWTKDGMRTTAPLPHCVGYIQKGEVERLLEAAHEQGWRNAINAGSAVILSREGARRR